MLLGLVAILLLIPFKTTAQEIEPRLASSVIARPLVVVEETATIKDTSPGRKPIVSKWSTNCVLYLRNMGYYVPQNPLIYAKTLPVATRVLSDGAEGIGVTYESLYGHVAVWRRTGSQICSVVDSAGTGRCMSINDSRIKGFL